MKRLLALITRSAQLIAESLAAKSQAESATRTAETLLENSSKSKAENNQSEANQEDLVKCLKLKDDEIIELTKSVKAAKIDMEVMKKQSESVSREYDNLLKEHAKLTSKLEKFENNLESKKDN